MTLNDPIQVLGFTFTFYLLPFTLTLNGVITGDARYLCGS